MDIILRKTVDSDASFMAEVERLYHSAFPEEERRDWSVFRKLLRSEPAFELLSIIDSLTGRWLGFITRWRLGTVDYYEHFAVGPEGRGNGVGSLVLAQLPDPCILEVEMPDDGIAGRRVGFYERNGFTAHPGFRYMQPSYREGGEDFTLMLMTRGDVDLEKTVPLIHRKVYLEPRSMEVE